MVSFISVEPIPYAIRNAHCGRRCCALGLFLLVAVALCAAECFLSPIFTIDGIPGFHRDLGYRHPRDAEKAAIKPHLDVVVRACNADPQFRRTLEGVWSLHSRSTVKTPLAEDRIIRNGITANAEHLSPYQTITLRLSDVRLSGAAPGEEN